MAEFQRAKYQMIEMKMTTMVVVMIFLR